MESRTDHLRALSSLADSRNKALNNSEIRAATSTTQKTTLSAALIENKPSSPTHEDLSKYELGDPNFEGEEADWSTTTTDSSSSGSSEGDEEGGIECDLSSKRFSSLGLGVSVVDHSDSTSSPYSTSPEYKPRPLPPLPVLRNPQPLPKMPGPNVPKPGPAKLSRNAGPEEWLEEAKQCHYLPEFVMKQLCEIVKEHLMEGASPMYLHDLC
jgi:hypothetical protein